MILGHDGRDVDGESFGRLPSLTQQIRELIHDYPEGIGIIKELIQNADDAGARTLSIILDPRSHPSDRLPAATMALLQGPALLCYNDSVFTDDDFDRIQELYQSGKVRAADKTGQFGKGFNTVYNVTDWPGFVTRDRVAFFDPHGSVVHGATREHPGWSWRLASCWDQYPDLLLPFTAAGLTPGDVDFPGTIFRLPFRNREQAERSEIAKRPFGTRSVVGLLRELIGVREELLLFLKNVEALRVLEVPPGSDGGLREILSVETVNDAEVRAAREEILAVLRGGAEGVMGRLRAIGPILVSYRHHFRSRWEEPDEDVSLQETETVWRVVSGLGLDAEGKIAETVDELLGREVKAVPLGGAAARIDAAAGERDYKDRARGKTYCSLPLPVETGFPVHLNGFFDLDSSRHALTTKAGLSGNASIRARWNELLIEHVVAWAYAHLIRALATDLGEASPEAYYAHWPYSEATSPQPLDKLSGHVYRHLAALSVIRASGKARWAEIGQIKVLPAGWEVLTAPFAAGGAALPEPPLSTSFVRGFEAAGVKVNYVKPARVREVLLRPKPLSVRLDQAPILYLRKRDWVEALLRFCLSDSPSDINGLPLAVTSNGLLRTFGCGPAREPLYLAAAEEREIFASKPEWFVDETFAAVCNLGLTAVRGIGHMGPAEVVECLPALLPLDSGLTVGDDEAGAMFPTASWLRRVYRFLIEAVRKGFRPKGERLQLIAMVPDQRWLLQPPGSASTPLLCRDSTNEALWSALDRFGVPIVTAPPELLEAIAAFAECCRCGFVWKLTGPDLVDTLATLDESSFTPPDRETQVALLDYISLSRWRTGSSSYSPEQRDKLRGLMIFPTISGAVVSLDGGALLPGDFTPPASGIALTLLDVGDEQRWRPLLEYLGVPILNRGTFIEEHLLEHYAQLPPKEQLKALRWLDDNLNRALSEREEAGLDPGELIEAVRQAPLIRCEDGKNRYAGEIYDPAGTLVRELFGAAAPFPDSNFYRKSLDRWLSFFKTIGMVDRPRAGDLLQYIDSLIADAERLDVSRVTPRLVKVFRHLDSHWEELRDEPVDDFVGDTLAEALRERAWLPAERQRLKRWPGAASPELRLYRPDELYLQSQANLIASQASILSISRVGAEIRKGLGIPDAPPLGTVLNHFEQLISLWESRSEIPAERTFGEALAEIYGYLAKHVGTNSVEHIRKRFSERPCLWHGGTLWPPRHAFRARVPYFGGRRVTITAKPPTRQTYQLLGQREQPELVDFLEHLDELLEEFDDSPLPAAEVTHLLALYSRLVQEPLYDAPNGRRFPLLTDTGQLVQSEEVFVDDAPWFSERIERDTIQLLHRGLPPGVRRLPWVRSLAEEVSERPIGTWQPAVDPKAIALSAKLGMVVKSDEFRKGLARLINHVHGVCRPAELSWLARASVSAVEEIRSELVVRLGGNEVVVGSGLAHHYWDAGNRTFFLDGRSGRLMPRHLAECIDGQIEGNKLQNFSDLMLILDCEPEEIEPTLDQIRVKPLDPLWFAPSYEGLADDIPGEEQDSEAVTGASEQWDGEQSESPADESAEHSSDREGFEDDGQDAAGNGNATSPDQTVETPTRTAADRAGERAQASGLQAGEQPGKATQAGSRPVGRSGGARSDRPAVGTSGTGGHPSLEGREAGASRPGSVQPRQRGIRPRSGTRRGDRAVTYVSGELGADGTVSSRPLTEEERRRNIELGDRAVELVCEFEQNHGRQPTRLPQNHPGYDVESLDPRVESIEPATGRSRLIEVKGIRGPWTRQGVALSSRQFRAAREHGDRFWLYVVEYADDPAHALVHPIRDPFARISEFWFDRGWRQLADPAESPSSSLRVEVGTRLSVEQHGPGMVSEILDRGALRVLVIQLDSGGELKRPYNARTMKPIDSLKE